jgi:hypothetical protein
MRRKEAAMSLTDLERDAHDVIEFFVALADQDATLVADFLLSAGIEPGTALPKNALVKLGVFCRLRLWENIGLTTGELPAADTVFSDIIAELSGEPPRFDIMALSRQVHTFAERRMTWPQSGAATFILDDRADSSQFLDGVAELLWNFRHLADGESACPSASPLANSGDGSAVMTAGGSTAPSPSTN